MCVGDELAKRIYVGHTYNHKNVCMQKPEGYFVGRPVFDGVSFRVLERMVAPDHQGGLELGKRHERRTGLKIFCPHWP